MTASPYREALEMIDSIYSSRLAKHGDDPRAAQWSDRATQERRMRILVEIGNLRSARVLDFGCGTGHLFSYLREQHGFAGEYVGYDISDAMIQTARKKFPSVRFERRDILTDPLDEEFDYVVANGVFNNRVPDGQALMEALLTGLFTVARKGLAFNCMSRYVHYRDPELAYYDPAELFTFCKTSLSPLVTMRHDYTVKDGTIPFEFTMYLFSSELPLVGSVDSDATEW